MTAVARRRPGPPAPATAPAPLRPPDPGARLTWSSPPRRRSAVSSCAGASVNGLLPSRPCRRSRRRVPSSSPGLAVVIFGVGTSPRRHRRKSSAAYEDSRARSGSSGPLTRRPLGARRGRPAGPLAPPHGAPPPHQEHERRRPPTGAMATAEVEMERTVSWPPASTRSPSGLLRATSILEVARRARPHVDVHGVGGVVERAQRREAGAPGRALHHGGPAQRTRGLGACRPGTGACRS